MARGWPCLVCRVGVYPSQTSAALPDHVQLGFWPSPAPRDRDDLAHGATSTGCRGKCVQVEDQAAPGPPTAPAPGPPAAPPADRTPAALAIDIRSNTRRLGRVLDRGLDRAGVLERDLERTSPLVRGLGLTISRALASNLARAVASDLDVANDLADALVRALVHGLDGHLNALNDARSRARHLAGDLVRDLDLDPDAARSRVSSIMDIITREHDRIRDLDRALGAQHVDASGADLTEIMVEDLGVLEGVILTGQTTWPPGIADQVRACSREIHPGVYQVDSGSNRDLASFAMV